MSYSLLIGNAIVKRAIPADNTVHLKMFYMHGDADAFTSETRKFHAITDSEKICKYVEGLNILCEDHYGRIERAEELSKLIPIFGTAEDAEDFFENVVTHDCTSDGYLAVNTGYRLTIWHDGAEYALNVMKDGVVISKWSEQ